MNLLILSSRFPLPLEKGDKLRLYHQIEFLSKLHDITLISLTEKPFDQELLQQMKPFCKEIYVIPHSRASNLIHAVFGLRLGLPANVGYFYRKSTRRKIEAIIERIRPDAIYVQLARMAPYVTYRDDIPRFIDYMDAFSLRVRRRSEQSKWPLSWFWSIETTLLERFERKIASHYTKRFIIANTDRTYLQDRGVQDLHILPNGVDTVYFTNPQSRPPAHDLVFVGNMSYHPNVMAANFLIEQIAKPLKEKRKDLTVLIAGASPTQEVKELENSWIKVSGFMPDIRMAYESGRIFVAPIFAGSGLQNKILEAMAMKLPCITSPQVSEAIGANEEILLTAENPADFIAKIESLLDHYPQQIEMAEKARAYVEQQFNWHTCCDPLAQLDQPQDVYKYDNWQ